ncbi:MAG TPA: hypothetical protein VF533_14760 [Solirubrobacteraceae bacterium]|jgi:NhaP-type Na+/H+ or K+/H+ antiporter
MPPPQSGHGPFGDRSFRVMMAVCAVLVVVGLAMMLGGGAVDDVGIAFVVLCSTGLAFGGGMLLLERWLLRRRKGS